MPYLDDRALEVDGRVEVGEHARRRRVGVVVGRDEDRLDRRHRALLGRRDPLLELAHLGAQRRLVADRARHAAEQRRDLGAGLDEAEDVVDEEQHVLALVAEVLRHRQSGEPDAQPCPGRLVHLPVDERDLVDHLRLLHLEPEVVPLARALADAREDGDAAVLPRDVVNQLLDEHGLADARAAEQPDLAAANEGRDQVDDLDSRLEDLDLRGKLAEAGRVAVDRPALHAVRGRLLVVDRLPDHVPEPAKRHLADGNRDRPAEVDDVETAREAVRGVHGNSAHAVVPEVLLHLGDHVAAVDREPERVVDLRQLVREEHVDDDALDLDQLADVLPISLLSHATPGEVFSGRGASRASPGRRAGVYPSRVRARPVLPPAVLDLLRPPHGRRGRGFRRTT